VRESIVKDVLAQRPGKVPATVPPRRRASVDQITASWLEDIRGSGIDVVGDLADLESVWPDDEGHWADPDRPTRRPWPMLRSRRSPRPRPVGRTPVADDDSGAVARLTRMLRG
jgi:hypothetical protein